MNFTLYFLCAVLLVLSRIGHDAVVEMRDGFAELTAPVLEAASKPVIMARQAAAQVRSYIGTFDEIDRLKAENEALKQWKWRAKLAERKVVHLRSLLNAVDEPALHFATGSVIADTRGPFLRGALINLGRDDGVRVGYAVINGDGLVGRTVDAGDSVARILLLSDLNSRIPVVVGRTSVRALASGDNSADLKLEFFPDGAPVKFGDEVFTSGSDGVLPRGLPVGVVTGEPGAFKVRTHANLRTLDAVSVLFFDTPTLTRTDPPVFEQDRALSASADEAEIPDAGPSASASPADARIKQAGASQAPSAGGVVRTRQ